jgi:hypothetical protein
MMISPMRPAQVIALRLMSNFSAMTSLPPEISRTT